MVFELASLAALILLNGVFALSELAIVSARPARLKAASASGGARARGAAAALRLAADPGRFLATVQIGITLVGVLAGAFSGATLGVRLTDWMIAQGAPDGLADALGVGAVVVAVTYFSLIVGELAPKRIALNRAEAMAILTAPAMLALSKLAAPAVWLLDRSSRGLLVLLGQGGEPQAGVTEEEVRAVVAEAESAGILESDEKEMIGGVMRLADRRARGLMTPRGAVEAINLADPPEAVLAQVRATVRSRLPVRDGGADDVIGVVYARDVLAAAAADPDGGSRAPLDLRALIRPAPVVADTARALDVMRRLRAGPPHMALVFDEYGHFEGVVTAGDVLETILGAASSDAPASPKAGMAKAGMATAGMAEAARGPAMRRLPGGTLWVAGWMPVDEFADRTDAPIPRDGPYSTMAGFMLHALNRVPEAGATVEVGNYRLEVVETAGRRVAALYARRMV